VGSVQVHEHGAERREALVCAMRAPLARELSKCTSAFVVIDGTSDAVGWMLLLLLLFATLFLRHWHAWQKLLIHQGDNSVQEVLVGDHGARHAVKCGGHAALQYALVSVANEREIVLPAP
jgi:hypothetical protein